MIGRGPARSAKAPEARGTAEKYNGSCTFAVVFCFVWDSQQLFVCGMNGTLDLKHGIHGTKGWAGLPLGPPISVWHTGPPYRSRCLAVDIQSCSHWPTSLETRLRPKVQRPFIVSPTRWACGKAAESLTSGRKVSPSPYFVIRMQNIIQYM